MVRASKKHDNGASAAQPNPEAEERKRLKKLAISKKILSDTPPSRSNYLQLSPSKTVMKHHGKDILKKSQRKNRFLFSFPGLLAPITGGKIGELKDLGTKNPILYLDFPQGQMKLFGTIVYPKNRYLTLQFSRGGKNVMCEDYFDTMIVFCDAWWIGKKDENPDESRLEFPKELNEGQPVEYDFKGGAGATSENKQGVTKAGLTYIEEQSPQTDLEDDSSNGEDNSIDLMKATPVRHSERTAGKRFNFAEVHSGGSSVDSEADMSEDETKVDVELGKNENFRSIVLDIDNEDTAGRTHLTGQVPEPTTSVAKSKKISQPANQVTRPEEISGRIHGSLVQATISTLFKKAEEKAPRDSKKSQSPKVSGHKLQHGNSKRKIDQADGPKKKGKVIEERKAGIEITARKKRSEDSNSVERVKVYERKTKSQAASAASFSLDDQASPVPTSNIAVPIATSQNMEVLSVISPCRLKMILKITQAHLRILLEVMKIGLPKIGVTHIGEILSVMLHILVKSAQTNFKHVYITFLL